MRTFGDRVIDVHGGEGKGTSLHHLVETMDTCCGLLADALDLFEDSLDAPEAAGPQCSDLAARGSGGRIGFRGFGRRRFGILFGFSFTGNFFFGLFHRLFFNQAGSYPVCAGAENQRQDTEAEQAKAVFQGNGIHISTGNDKKQSGWLWPYCIRILRFLRILSMMLQ